MREKEGEEREGEGSRRGRSRAGSSNRRSHGYIHNVDQSSTSFFVTNFPEDSTSEDLWKVFAKFGRLGDVYIPSKEDKWGKKFAFVKFREVKEEWELSQRLKDVWLGSFKLRINKSHFERKTKKAGSSKPLVDGGYTVQPGRSFRLALENPSLKQEELVKGKEVLEEVLKVEVDDRLLKELEASFVGKLALQVEVKRIKTILFMEGLSHIAVTDMGRDLVLIFSPKVGEVEKLWNSKADWMRYYFKDVSPWRPSSFVDRRDIWVRVYGIPLHVWGENLFKVIGGKYGEFLDFDNCTASRAKLDIARIKISTNFRGYIDDPVNILAMGVTYSLRVVEEKEWNNVGFEREIDDEQERCWEESPCSPKAAWEEDGGMKVGLVAEDEGDSVEELESEAGDDLHLGQSQVRESSVQVGGDVSLVSERKGQTSSLVSASILLNKEGNLLQKATEVEEARGGANNVEATKEDRRKEIVVGGSGLMETCLLGESDKGSGGSGEVQMVIESNHFGPFAEGQPINNGPFLSLGPNFVLMPNRSRVNFRSASLPPCQPGGSSLVLESAIEGDLDFSDSISLVEVQGGAIPNSGPSDDIVSQRSSKRSFSRRGRSRKPRSRSKHKKKNMGGPKFVHLMEAVKEVGGKQKRKTKMSEAGVDQSDRVEIEVGGLVSGSIGGEEDTVVPSSCEGLMLEVVLPGIVTTPSSGLNLLLDEDNDPAVQHTDQVVSDSAKLLRGDDGACYS
ncbi:hypothetical protein TSUD_330530 [Trifolium subterraneum]|nr:hypothetical protein TSUD_330530 [Trifolium subterraneum]